MEAHAIEMMRKRSGEVCTACSVLTDRVMDLELQTSAQRRRREELEEALAVVIDAVGKYHHVDLNWESVIRRARHAAKLLPLAIQEQQLRRLER